MTAAPPGSLCGSCGSPAPYLITLHGKPMPACLRHLNVWKNPEPRPSPEQIRAGIPEVET